MSPATLNPDDSCVRATELVPGHLTGSFRELVLWEIDGNPLVDSTLNMRAEPLANRQ